jgi:hypothetical protein
VTFVVEDFTISATTPVPVNAESSAISTITVGASNLFVSTVSLTYASSTGLSCGPITPTNLTGSGSATVSCSANSAGNYTLTVTGTSTNLVHTTTSTFTFQDYTITASSPTEANVQNFVSSTITIAYLNGFSGTLNLTGIAPSGLTCGAIIPRSVTSPGTANVSCSSMTAGNYTLIIMGNSTTLIHSTEAVFKFGDFTLSATSSGPLNVNQSSSVSISLTPFNHFTGTVSLTENMQTGLSCGQISPSSLTGSGTASLTCTATSAGNYTVQIRGIAGSLMHTTTLVIQITDFSVAANPTLITSPVGTNATSIIMVSSLNGYDGTVNVTAAVQSQTTTGGSGGLGGRPRLEMSPLASEPDPIVTPGSLFIIAGGNGQYTLTVVLPSGTLPGNYTIIVTATNSLLFHSIQLTIAVSDFSLSSPTSTVSISPGSNSTITLNLQSLNGFQADLNISTTINPTGPVASVNPSSLFLSSTSSSILTITIPSNTLAGNYTLTVQAGTGTLSHTILVSIQVRTGQTSIFTRIVDLGGIATTGLAGLIALVSLFSIRSARTEHHLRRRNKRQSLAKRTVFRDPTRKPTAPSPTMFGPFAVRPRLSD